MTLKISDQAALSFINNQLTYIEGEVDKIEYPDIQYPELIPVDFSAPDWVKTVTYFSSDRVGKADWFNANSRDVPKVDLDRQKFETSVELASIGYGWNIEEIAQAQAAGVKLGADKADAAREAYEEFVDDIALYGNADKGMYGLIAYPGVSATNALADGAGGGGSSSLWANKTPVQIARDINSVITGVWVTTKQIGLADTILLPPSLFSYLGTTMFDTNGNVTIMDWIKRNNILTMTTGRALTIRAVRGLETAGASSSARMVAYRRDPKVLKMHIPMRHRFLDAMRSGPIMYEVPGIFRLGGLDVKRPAMIRYLDQIG